MGADTRVIDIPTTSATTWVLETVDKPSEDIISHLIGYNLRGHIGRRALAKDIVGKLER